MQQCTTNSVHCLASNNIALLMNIIMSCLIQRLFWSSYYYNKTKTLPNGKTAQEKLKRNVYDLSPYEQL